MSKVSYKFGDPLPKSLGICTDQLKQVTKLRLLMEKDVKDVKKRETEISEHLIDELSASDDTGVSGKFYQSKIQSDKEPTADDWELIHEYVYDNDRFDLLGKSLNKKAVKEMWDAGKKIPGVKKINVKKLSITKVK